MVKWRYGQDLDLKDIKDYFDWKEIGDRILNRALEIRGKIEN